MIERIVRLLARARKGWAYLARGDLKGFLGRSRSLLKERSATVFAAGSLPADGGPLQWAVMATPHTTFIAHLVARRLREHGWAVTISMPDDTPPEAHFYFVVCPQMFPSIPPGPRRFVYQMEQSVSSRWFTRGYLNLLRSSRATLDYALVNLDFLDQQQLSYPDTYYLPVGADPDYALDLDPEEKRYDVLFYGDSSSSPRRQKLLAALDEHFSVHRCSEVFGDDMRREIMRAKVVVNLHYYEDALLEMPRIQECLSLGVPVVSEASQDQNDYREVASAVRFFPQGDIPAMVAAVGHALAQPISSATVRAAAEAGWLRFKFMFDRFLLGNRLLRPTQLTQARLPVPADTDRFVLSLPETIRRRRTYLAQPVSDAAVFDGLRYTPGWLGCGMSYSALARHRLGQGGQDMMVIEDDAFLPGDFEERIAIVRAYLESRDGQWDLFAGLIADLHPETRVLNVEHFDGLRFVTIDRMTSMVCNIYGRSAQQLLAAWNPSNQDADTNTIDCYLERSPGLRVVVALPFVAGLRQGLDSTLWGVDNSHYIERVAATQAKLDGMADAFEQTQA